MEEWVTTCIVLPGAGVVVAGGVEPGLAKTVAGHRKRERTDNEGFFYHKVSFEFSVAVSPLCRGAGTGSVTRDWENSIMHSGLS